MRIRNETGADRCPFKVHLADGAEVDVPERVMKDPDKVAYLRRNFTEVLETAVAEPPAEPTPTPDPPDDAPPIDMTPRPRAKKAAKKKARRGPRLPGA